MAISSTSFFLLPQTINFQAICPNLVGFFEAQIGSNNEKKLCVILCAKINLRTHAIIRNVLENGSSWKGDLHELLSTNDAG